MTVQNLRVNTRVPFPPQVIGTGGVVISKQMGVWQVSLAFQNLVTEIPLIGNYPNDYIVVYDSVANTYFKMSLVDFNAITSTIATARLASAAASVPITVADIEVGIDTVSGATACPLPTVAAWSAQQPFGLEMCIFDYTGHASATNTITPTLNGTDVFVQGVTPVVTKPYGLIRMRPILTSPNKWYVRGVE